MYTGKTFQIGGQPGVGTPYRGKTFTIPEEKAPAPQPTAPTRTIGKPVSWKDIAYQFPGALKQTLQSAFPGFSGETLKNITQRNDAWDKLPFLDKVKLFGGEFGKNLLNVAESIPRAAVQFIATPTIGAVEEITDTALGEVKFPGKIGDWVGPMTGTKTQLEGYKRQGLTETEAKTLVIAQQAARSLSFVATFGAPAYIESIIRRPTVEETYTLKFEIEQAKIGEQLVNSGKLWSKLPKSSQGYRQWAAGIKGEPNKYVVVHENPYGGKIAQGFTVNDPVLAIHNKAFLKTEITAPKGLSFPTQNLALPGIKQWISFNPVGSHVRIMEEAITRALPTIIKKKPAPLPKIPPPIPVPQTGIDTSKVQQNTSYKQAKIKLENQGAQALTNQEIETLSNGLQETITADGVKPISAEDVVSNELLELYSGIPLKELASIPITVNGAKMKLIDALGKVTIRYHGLTPEVKDVLLRLEGTQQLTKEQLKDYFIKEFPIDKNQAKLLLNHQENPTRYPITPELVPYAEKVEELIKLSEKLQRERNLQKEFFPQSFINKAQKDIQQHIDAISIMTEREKIEIPGYPALEKAHMVKQEKSIAKHQEEIDELEEYVEMLKGIRYAPHLYLFSEEIQRNFLKLMPEGKITAKFRSALTKLRGRKIATLDDAKELGLIPEEDVRIVLASHFEYLFRKLAIHDSIEELKKNPNAILLEKDAPDDWDRLALSQLSGYKVHPMLSAAIEDLALNYETSIIGKGYDAINHLGKAIVFYNPLILPFWNIFQAYAAGSVRPWRPIYTSKLVVQAWKQVLGKGPLYQAAVTRGLYTTPKVGYYSPPIENTMQVIINQMEKDYPGWKKAVEKITGKPINWKTFVLIPDLYTTNWRLTWFLDRVQRTITLIHGLNKGMDMPVAIERAKTFHANYNIFTRRAKKWLNRLWLVPTYKANMLVKMPSYVAKKTFDLAKSIPRGGPTPEQKASLGTIWRILLLGAGALTFAAWRGYYLREGYRLVKRLDEPEITPEGKVITERVITLPGPFAEWPKLIERIKKGPKGLYMYLAKVPQIVWGLARNARWTGESYYDEGAAGEVQRRQIMVNLVKDYIAPIDRISMMTDEETEAIDNIFTFFGMATYKRGGTEQRIMWQIREEYEKIQKYLKKPNVSIEDKNKALEDYQNKVLRLNEELEEYIETYK